MQVALIISIILVTTLGAETASGQSAFLEKGQSGTGVGLTYMRDQQSTGLGIGTVFSTEGRTDVTLAVFRISSGQTRAYGAGVEVSLLKTFKGSDQVGGLPLSLEYLNPPGRGGPTLTGSAGMRQEFPINTGHGTRLVFSIGLSAAYIITADPAPADRTIEIIQAGMGQSISLGNGNFCLLSVGFGYNFAYSDHEFVGFEIGFLFPD